MLHALKNSLEVLKTQYKNSYDEQQVEISNLKSKILTEITSQVQISPFYTLQVEFDLGWRKDENGNIPLSQTYKFREVDSKHFFSSIFEFKINHKGEIEFKIESARFDVGSVRAEEYVMTMRNIMHNASIDQVNFWFKKYADEYFVITNKNSDQITKLNSDIYELEKVISRLEDEAKEAAWNKKLISKEKMTLLPDYDYEYVSNEKGDTIDCVIKEREKSIKFFYRSKDFVYAYALQIESEWPSKKFYDVKYFTSSYNGTSEHVMKHVKREYVINAIKEIEEWNSAGSQKEKERAEKCVTLAKEDIAKRLKAC